MTYVTEDLPSGALGLLNRYILDTAIKPQPWLATGASLAALGALMGRKYRTETNLRTNLYTVGMADSGAGKDHARNAIKEAFIAAGLHQYLGGNRIASGAGLLSALQRQPAILFQKDEFGQFLGSIADKRRAPKYLTEIWDLLIELYTSAGGTFLGSEYADQRERPKVDIVQPCCCLHATTVPGPFWAALKLGALYDGGLARLLVFRGDGMQDSNLNPRSIDDVPGELIASLQAIERGIPDRASGNLNNVNGANINPTPSTVPMDDEARDVFLQLDRKQTKLLREAAGTEQSAIIARVWENTAKVALIMAVSDNPSAPVIRWHNASMAQAYVELCTKTLIDESTHYLADNQLEEYTKRVLRLVVGGGEAGISKKDITRKTQYLTKQQRDEILETLVLSNQVAFRVEFTAGRPVTTYFAVSETADCP
jgi:hypothetical protein